MSDDTQEQGGRIFRRALALIDRSTRRRLYMTVPMAIVASMFEAIGLALVLPYIELLAEESSTLEDLPGPAQGLAEFLGATNADEAFVVLGIAIGALLLIKTVITATFTFIQMKIIVRGEKRLAVQLFDRYMEAPYQFHLVTNSAETIRNLRASINQVIRRVLVSWTQLLTEVTLVLVIAIALVVVDPFLALLTLTFLGLMAVLYIRGISSRARRLGRVDQEMTKRALMVMQESLGGLRAYRSLNREASAVQEFSELRDEWEPVKHQTMFLSVAPRFYLEICIVIGTGAVITYVFATSEDTRALGLLALVIAATFRILPSLQRILSALNQTRVGAAAVESVEATLEQLAYFDALDGVIRDEADTYPEQVPFTRALTFDKVEFSYHGSDGPALRDVSFHVGKGQSVGLIGPSGAGKSTAVDLVLGLLYPTSGQVLIDAKPLTPRTAPAWRNHIGYVPQDIYLADRSLAHNIALGVDGDEIDVERVRRAAAAAQLLDFIDSLPEGLDTPIGERGTRLSGGQRQRVGIARALYDEPDVLVLDEATSALDGATEASISSVIDSLRGELTMIIVAHRLSTVRQCDQLIHFENGRIRSMGDFEHLLRSDDQFTRLVELAELR